MIATPEHPPSAAGLHPAVLAAGMGLNLAGVLLVAIAETPVATLFGFGGFILGLILVGVFYWRERRRRVREHERKDRRRKADQQQLVEQASFLEAQRLAALNVARDANEARQTLQQLKDQLDERVRQRTRELAGAVESLHAEIARREATEHALARSLREVGEFKTALDEHAIVAITDQQGRITYVNDKFCAISRYSREELIGQDHRIINSGYHPKEFIRDLWTTIARGCVWHGEIKNRAKDGSFYWVDTTIVPFLNEHGKPRQYVAVRADITQIKETQDELARSNRDLEQFAYIASHDLQEPLRAVASCLQVLQVRYQGSLDAKADELIGHAVDGATRMRTLIEGLLAFSRLGMRGRNFELVDMGRAVDDARKNLASAIQENEAMITCDSMPAIRADPVQLALLFQNLIGNAIKFRRAEPPRIKVQAKRSDHGWVFSVHDNGLGVEPDYFERIFVIFQRLHTRREFPGTGLGLAICKKIVERHRGRIWVESESGRGSTFFFHLPDA